MLCVNAVAVPRAGALFIALGFVGYSIAMPGFTIGGQNTEKRPDIDITGIDVLVRQSTRIPVEPFDGTRIPYADRSVDVVMFLDVLHHAGDPAALLREAARTATQAVLIKDHTLDGMFAGPTLRFMDWVGNARHGVTLPYNYWNRQTWLEAFKEVGLAIGVWRSDLGIYPWPATWLFDRSLHFVARLDI